MHNTTLHFGDINAMLHTFLGLQRYRSVFILVDENTKRDCLPLLKINSYKTIEIKSGEQNKNIQTCQQIWSKLLTHEAKRNSLFINLGGGVITDMGGFCASTFKRGIDFINIPTTLLAMVDASIGGKTGIDFYNQKNMIGLFSQPKAVFIDNSFLNTLEERQLNAGKAEMLKHGIIANETHFKNIPVSDIPNIALIKESIEIKSSIVDEDPEEKNIRKMLNFGHTLGHALESYCLSENYDLLHGEAVAKGMLWAIDLSVTYNQFPALKATELKKLISQHFKGIHVKNKTLKSIIDIAKNDKKNEKDTLSFCLLNEKGEMQVNHYLNSEQVYQCLNS